MFNLFLILLLPFLLVQDNLTKNAEMIELKSHYNGKGMRQTLMILLKQAQDAQQFINQNGRAQVKSILRAFIGDVSKMIDQYIEHVESRVSFRCRLAMPNLIDRFACRSKMK